MILLRINWPNFVQFSIQLDVLGNALSWWYVVKCRLYSIINTGHTKRRRADGPDDGSVRVVKSVWYCKHTDICYNTTSPMDERTERRLCYGAMTALSVGGGDMDRRPPVIRTTGRPARRLLVRPINTNVEGWLKTGQLIVRFSIIFLTGQSSKNWTVRSKTGHLATLYVIPRLPRCSWKQGRGFSDNTDIKLMGNLDWVKWRSVFFCLRRWFIWQWDVLCLLQEMWFAAGHHRAGWVIGEHHVQYYVKVNSYTFDWPC